MREYELRKWQTVREYKFRIRIKMRDYELRKWEKMRECGKKWKWENMTWENHRKWGKMG